MLQQREMKTRWMRLKTVADTAVKRQRRDGDVPYFFVSDESK